MLLDSLIEKKKKKLKAQEANILKVLQSTPDFYLEMKWDFESNVIPFFSKLAPTGKYLSICQKTLLDTFKIWKYKNCLRLDNNIVGFKNLKAKKRDMSLIFNPNLKDNLTSGTNLFSLNRSKKQFTNVMVKKIASLYKY